MRRNLPPTGSTRQGAGGTSGVRQTSRSSSNGVGQSRAAAAGATVALGGNGNSRGSRVASGSGHVGLPVTRPGSSQAARPTSLASSSNGTPVRLSVAQPALSAVAEPRRQDVQGQYSQRRRPSDRVVEITEAEEGPHRDPRNLVHGASLSDDAPQAVGSLSSSSTDARPHISSANVAPASRPAVASGVVGGASQAMGSSSRESSPSSGESVSVANDPFGLDGQLFQCVAQQKGHGEMFVGYRLRGNPMVLHSLVDGSPLVSLHFRVARPGANALIARRPDRASFFQGVVSEDNQAFELVMTNLTTEDVIMFDIGGDARTREDEFWNHDDKSFWSGRHRNDQRLNGSNILWPMQPNVCLENNFHFMETGERRQLILRRRDTAPVDSDNTAGNAARKHGSSTYPLLVYPKYGSRTASKFARTAWSCPESIVVIGNPSLVGAAREGCNIQVEAPRGNENDRGAEGVARTFGVSVERLFEVLGVDREFLSELPEELQQEIMMQQLSSVDPTLLRPESPEVPDVPENSFGGIMRTQLDEVPQQAPELQREATIDSVALGAAPASVGAGRRLRGVGTRGLLIEKFDFGQRGADAVLALGVDERVQLLTQTQDRGSGEFRDVLTNRIRELTEGRTDSLREEISSVYQTKECVICLSGDPLPDVILYQCGHRCAHLECLEEAKLRRCPLCRAPIVAMLPCK